jgi:hypothetical protein
MKVDTQPFPSVNMVEGCDRSTRRQLDFAFGINMAGPAPRRYARKEKADPCDRSQKGEKEYITKEQVRHVRNQRPASAHLLKKYECQYRQRLQYELEDEEYEHRTGKSLKKCEDRRNHWHCPFFKYCWGSSMNRLPSVNDCPECRSRKCDVEGISVFRRLGPMPPQHEQAELPRRKEDFEEEEDKYHRLRWCPDGLNHSQKRRVQWLRSLEEAEAKYLEMIRKARPDLADKVHYTQKRESRPPKKEWRPKPKRANAKTSADAHMVFVLPAEFYAQSHEELPVA